jgi:hypothetical protein
MKKLVMGVLFAGLATACGGGSNKPDASTIDAALSCNPLDQTGCEAGEKCTWVIDQDNPRVGHIDCAPDGTVAANGACTYGPAGPMGYDNCVAGTACSSGECKVLCDQNEVSPLCPADYSCGLYENFFDQGGQTVAGVCDSNCDPLNQNTLATDLAACGSIDPANPNKGCYVSNGYRQFTCSPANNSTGLCTGQPGCPADDNMFSVLHRIDDVLPRTNSAGRPYPNGCAPGYQAVFFEGPTMMVAKCTGLCAPSDTDSGTANPGPETPAGAGSAAASAKLVTDAAPAVGNAMCKTTLKGSVQNAKGDGSTQNCRYIWRYLLAMDGTPSTSRYNDTLGVCYNFKEWTWDDDMNPATPEVQDPSCTSLPQSMKQNAGAASHACYSLARTLLLPEMLSDGKVKLHPSQRRFRVGYEVDTMVRHSYH